MASRHHRPSLPFSTLYLPAASEYIPTIGDRVSVSETEAEELVKQRSELIAQLRAPLRAEQAAYRQAAADLEEGELLDPQYKYIPGPSQALDSHSQSTDSSKSKIPVYKDPASSPSSNNPREQACNISKTKPVNTSREVGTRVEAREPIRPPAQPTVASPLPPRPTVLESSAFSQLGARNAKIAKEERTRFEEEETLRKCENEKTAICRVAPKSRVTKSQNTRVSKARPSASANAAPQRNHGRTPDYAYSISTGAPPRSAAPKPTTSREDEAAGETMISGQVGSIRQKRRAEEDLESLNTKIAKQDNSPFPEYQPAGPKRAIAPAKDLTDYEVIFGKGSKPRKPNIQRIPVPRSNGPDQHPIPVSSDEDTEGVKHRDEKRRDNQPYTEKAAMKQLADHYEAFAGGLVPEVEEVVASCPDLDQKGRTSREVGGQRYRVRKSFEEHNEEISLSAYLGELVHQVATEEEPTPSPFKFLQAFGTLFHDDGNPLNGETSQDAKQFVDEVLTRLQEEELEQAVLRGHVDGTLVQEIFGVKTSKHLYCAACEFSKDEDIVVDISIDVVLPRNKATITLANLLKSTGTGQLLADYECPNPSCNVRNRTVERYQLEGTSKYLIVQVSRVGEKLDKDGRIDVSDMANSVSAKLQGKIQFPKDAVDLSTLMPEKKRIKDANYELFGMVMHRGANYYDGHYMALRKVNGQWWECNDERVTAIAHEDFSDYDNGQLFFLKRVD